MKAALLLMLALCALLLVSQGQHQRKEAKLRGYIDTLALLHTEALGREDTLGTALDGCTKSLNTCSERLAHDAGKFKRYDEMIKDSTATLARARSALAASETDGARVSGLTLSVVKRYPSAQMDRYGQVLPSGCRDGETFGLTYQAWVVGLYECKGGVFALTEDLTQ
jgi:hypothetical protein